jgi:hypothetical protein
MCHVVHRGSLWVFITIIALLNNSCQLRRDKLCRVWFYQHERGADPQEQCCLIPASFLNIQQDGTYTLYFSQFEYGTWQLDDTVLVLTNQHRHTTQLHIDDVVDDKLCVHFTDKPNQRRFEGANNEFDNEDDNPFCRKNNEWRLPPSHKESDPEIAARLRNHFHFWEKYFDWGMHHIKGATVDAHTPPTLMRLHGNGLAVTPFDELSDRWVASFYDKEDCSKASNKVTNFFISDDIDWPNTENKYQLFISAFQQMEEKIR